MILDVPVCMCVLLRVDVAIWCSDCRDLRKKACLFQGKLSFPIRLHLGYISGGVILVYPQGRLTVDMCPAYRSRFEIQADLLKH